MEVGLLFGSLLSISGGGNGGTGSASGNNGGIGGDSPSPVLVAQMVKRVVIG